MFSYTTSFDVFSGLHSGLLLCSPLRWCQLLFSLSSSSFSKKYYPCISIYLSLKYSTLHKNISLVFLYLNDTSKIHLTICICDKSRSITYIIHNLFTFSFFTQSPVSSTACCSSCSSEGVLHPFSPLSQYSSNLGKYCWRSVLCRLLQRTKNDFLKASYQKFHIGFYKYT